jgi:hypothetical protein
MLDHRWAGVDAAGRDRSAIAVAFGTAAGGDPWSDGFDAGARLAALDELASLGVTWTGVTVPGTSLSAAHAALQAYGDRVITPT